MSVIIGAKTIEQLDDNLAAGEARARPPRRWRTLDRVSALEPEYPGWMIARQADQRIPAPKELTPKNREETYERTVKWGVLGVAKIATEKVIPAMQRGALADRGDRLARRAPAREAAEALGIAKAYGSYEELLADPEIEAIYNPLPNELHVPWTDKALAAGKHVLCEKPIALDAEEAQRLIAARDASGKLVAEAFMVRFHPQWRRAREHRRGRAAIGEVARDPDPVLLSPARRRQHPQQAAGRRRALRHRLLRDPDRALHLRRRADARRRGARRSIPKFGTDRLASAHHRISGRAASDVQRRHATRRRAARDHRGRGGADRSADPVQCADRPADANRRSTPASISSAAARASRNSPICDQYTLQGDAFSRAMLGEAKARISDRGRHRQHAGHRRMLPVSQERALGDALRLASPAGILAVSPRATMGGATAGAFTTSRNAPRPSSRRRRGAPAWCGSCRNARGNRSARRARR